MKRFGTVLLLCLSALFAHSQTVMSLAQCIKMATDKNVSVMQGEANMEFSRHAYTQSKLLLLPSLNAGGTYFFNYGKTVDPVTNLPLTNNFQTNSYFLNSGLTVYNGGINANTIKKASSDLTLSKVSYDAVIQDVKLQVVVAYLNILFAKEELNSAQAKEKTSQQQLDNSTKLADAGSIPRSDLLSLQAQLAQDQLSVIQAQNQLDRNYLDLKVLLQLDPQETIAVVIPDISIFDMILAAPVPNADSVANYAIAHQSSVLKYEYQLQSDLFAEKIALGAGLPSLSLVGSLSTDYSDASYFGIEPEAYRKQLNDNLGEAFGISLNIPIFNNGQVSLNQQSAQLNYINTQLEQQGAINQLRQNVIQAVYDLIASRASYEAALQSYQAASNAFDFAEKKYNLGSLSSIEYTSALNTRAQSEAMLIQAKYDLIFKSKFVDYYLDKPLDL